MAEELKFVKKDREPWTPKRIATTVVIAILALLMIGGFSYMLIIYQQDHDDSNVFGYFDGQPIKYEPNTVFYNTLNSNSDYMNAYLSGDWNAMWSLWYSAFQNEVVYRALADMAKKAGVVTTDELVNQTIINSGIYAGEDGTRFDESVYRAASPANRTATYNYVKKIYPYSVVSTDIQTAVVGAAESSFVSEMSKDTRSFDYFVVGSNAIPDDFALGYDISQMPETTDEEGNVVEPTLAQIKDYIASSDPDIVAPYIQDAVAGASGLVSSDFDGAATLYGNGIITVSNATNNVGNSTTLTNGIGYVDTDGHLTGVFTQELARELYTAPVDYVAGPVAASDGSSIFVKVTSTDSDDSWESFIGLIYPYNARENIVSDFTSEVLASDRLQDNFSEKFLKILLNSMSTSTATF